MNGKAKNTVFKWAGTFNSLSRLDRMAGLKFNIVMSNTARNKSFNMVLFLRILMRLGVFKLAGSISSEMSENLSLAG